jgi:hypothetical protein
MSSDEINETLNLGFVACSMDIVITPKPYAGYKNHAGDQQSSAGNSLWNSHFMG